MKIQLRPSGRSEGSVLLITLSICVLLGVLAGSYLCLIQAQRLGVARGEAWDSSLVVAEAGVEEAMAHLNSGVATNNLATNSWVSLGAGIVGKTNFLGTSYSFTTIKIPPAVTNTSPLITSTAYVPGPLSGPTLTRTIQISTRGKTSGGNAGGGVIAKGIITFSGSKVTVDSFNSSDTNYSTGGLYDSSKAEANANLTTTSTLSNAMSVSEAQVFGSTHTVSGVQTIVDTSKQGTGSVGDNNWVNGGNLGVQSGHSAQDASYTFTDVTLPSLAWVVPAALKGNNALKTNGITFPYILNNLSPWQIPDLASSIYVSAPNVVLYVNNSLSLGSGTEIYLAPGASLTMYVGAASANIGGQGIVNSSGLAKNFTYYGLPTNTSLGLQANASFNAQIYAPEADITFGGGGSSPYDFSGQIVGNSFKMNGHFNLHYDEGLQSSGSAITGYVASSWNER